MRMGRRDGFALIALTITSQTETANERLRRIFASGETSAIAGMPPRVAQLESETQLLVAQVRALTTERDRLSGRIALLESSIDDMSGAIKKQAAATAALLAARVNPPTTSPTVAVLAARVTRSTNCRGNGVTAY
jgi:peptidoglycan hydrolase CwlO-like protein